MQISNTYFIIKKVHTIESLYSKEELQTRVFNGWIVEFLHYGAVTLVWMSPTLVSI